VAAEGDRIQVDLGGWALRARRRGELSGQVLAVFRPEAVALTGEELGGSEATVGEAVVVSREFLGAVLRYRLRLDDGRVIHLDEHKPDAARLRKEGVRVRFVVRPDDVMLFPLEERE
jgi:ABC-type Fe3+/spermidine/putrescine transport system ATPase subunit